MKGYKGFDEHLKCRGKQYTVRKTEEEKCADLCNSGMHFCENPLDCFRYYPPANSRYCEVDAEEVTKQKDNDDSKRTAKRLTIVKEIGLDGLIEAGVEFILKKAGETGNIDERTGDQSAAANTGDRSAATNTGDRSAATNTGFRSAATNTGNQSVATNTGDWSVAANTGDRSAATNTGNQSAATNTGDWSAASVSGKSSVAIAAGIGGKAKGAVGCAIVLCEYDADGNLSQIVAQIVDGRLIKPDTYYTLKNGVLVVEEER